MDDLDKIDVLRERMSMTYAQAKDALDAAGGNLIDALIAEEQGTAQGQMRRKGKEVWHELKGVANKASKAKISLKKGSKVLFTIPAPLGIIGLVGAVASTEIAAIGLAGTAVALAKRYSLEINSGSANHPAAQPAPAASGGTTADQAGVDDWGMDRIDNVNTGDI
ncbi:MAG TPA: DUF4342 domain-containing protein [Desulfobacteria bacterium]|nr:DUF4342 domain-containing protein [Desulfobacteria bacterium]